MFDKHQVTPYSYVGGKTNKVPLLLMNAKYTIKMSGDSASVRNNSSTSTAKTTKKPLM